MNSQLALLRITCCGRWVRTYILCLSNVCLDGIAHIFVYVYIYEYMYVYMSLHRHTYAYMYEYKYIHVYLYIHVYVCIYFYLKTIRVTCCEGHARIYIVCVSRICVWSALQPCTAWSYMLWRVYMCVYIYVCVVVYMNM